MLESTWELEIAEYLDASDIQWIRPTPLQWIDVTGKSRLYYPDFYLPEYDVYLDPKNPYCMQKDIEKMTYIRKRYNVQYGGLAHIRNIVLCILLASTDSSVR